MAVANGLEASHRHPYVSEGLCPVTCVVGEELLWLQIGPPLTNVLALASAGSFVVPELAVSDTERKPICKLVLVKLEKSRIQARTRKTCLFPHFSCRRDAAICILRIPTTPNCCYAIRTKTHVGAPPLAEEPPPLVTVLLENNHLCILEARGATTSPRNDRKEACVWAWHTVETRSITRLALRKSPLRV